MTSKSFEWRKKWKPSCCLRVRPGFAAYLEVICNMCLSWIVRVRPGFAAYLEGVVWRSWRSSSITILTHGSLPLSMQATCLWKKMNTTDECTLPHHDFISQMKECKLYKSTRKSSFLWNFFDVWRTHRFVSGESVFMCHFCRTRCPRIMISWELFSVLSDEMPIRDQWDVDKHISVEGWGSCEPLKTVLRHALRMFMWIGRSMH